MTTPTETLFLLLKQKKYADMVSLIATDTDLVNAINPRNGNSLLQSLPIIKVVDQITDLVQFIVTNPKFDISYVNPRFDLTNIDHLISSTRVDLFQSVIRNPEILFNKDKLAYQSAKEYLALAKETLDSDFREDPHSDATEFSRSRVASLEEIISLLREATVLYAILKDDARLMDKLEAAGGNPSERLVKLGNGKLPVHLLKEDNPDLTVWFSARKEKMATSMATNPFSFHKIEVRAQELEARLVDLDAQRSLAKTAATKQLLEADEGIIQRLTVVVGRP